MVDPAAQGERKTMHAERDDEGLRPIRKAREKRLAYEIALGIWIGGIALGLTWGVVALLMARGLVLAITG